MNLFAGSTWLGSEIVSSNVRADVGKQFAKVAPLTGTLWGTWDMPHDLRLGAALQSWTCVSSTT